MGDPNRGIYHKFKVERVDGESRPRGKHHACHYFVLDLDHDPHAKAAIEAYAESCKDAFPKLARDLKLTAKTSAFGSR